MSRNFTTSKPKTIFSLGQFAKFTGVARQTITDKWHQGKIKAIGITEKGKPLFTADQSSKVKDERFNA